MLFSAKAPTSKIAKPKNKDKNRGINIRAKGINPLNISSCVKDIEIQQLPNKKKPKPKAHPKQKKYLLYFFFLYLDCVLFLTSKIKNNKIENVKKFIIVKLYGAKPSTVTAPSKKGAKNITKNLLLSKAIKLIYLLLINQINNSFFNFIHFKIIFILNVIITYQMLNSVNPNFIKF